MPSWGAVGEEIQAEFNATNGTGIRPDGVGVIDHVRRKYIKLISDITGRPTVLYATRWTITGTAFAVPPDTLSIVYEDVHGFMETLHGLQSSELNLILHSPGGSPNAAAAIVQYIRSKFDNVVVYVPHMAMSAATMIACASNSIVMGRHSSIGPVDPQFNMQTNLGIRMVPAQTIVDQFEKAKEECADPAKLAAWAPMLAQYGPDLLVACQNAQDLSKQLVSEWLKSWMFADEADAEDRANSVAEWLANHKEFKDHGRPISRDDAISHGLKIDLLEDNQDLQDAVLSAFHATSHTFSNTSCAKIIENNLGRAFLKLIQS
nr:serine protease [Rhizobium sp. Q54]